MANVKWIKIVTDLFDDEKIKFIETMPNGDAYIVIWFKLLCLCGKSNCGGFLMFTSKLAYTDEMLSSIFNRDIKEIQMALKLFEQLEMIEISDNRICVANWEKHQSLDKLEAKKEYDREYQRKKREQNKLLIENRTSVVQASNDNRSLDIEVDIELDKDIDIKENNKKKTTTKVFVKPSLEEVRAYCEERKNGIDAEVFIAFYESKGWKVGKTPMKNWKAAMITWENRRKETLENKPEIKSKYTTGGFETLDDYPTYKSGKMEEL